MNSAFKSIDKKEYFPHTLLFQWLIFITVMMLAFWLAWQYGLIQNIAVTDPTYLSIIISLIFIGGTIHCLTRVISLSNELDILHTIINTPQLPWLKDQQLWLGNQALPSSLLTNYLSNILYHATTRHDDEKKLLQLENVFAEKINGSHESGWFFTGLLIKLGLLGTVIGFILMLMSITNLGSVDPEQIYRLFSEMTYGMRVALNTTLAGLVGTILLGLQYLMLDRAADKLLSDTVQLIECRFNQLN